MLLGLEKPSFVLKVLTLFILMSLMLTLPRQPECVASTLVQRNEKSTAVIPPLQWYPILLHFLLQTAEIIR